MDSDKIYFEKLTPVNNVDLKIYKNAIDFAFQNSDVKNIAISGPFSAGKSSIIETYKELNPDKKLIHISLADFSNTPDYTIEKNDEHNESKKDDGLDEPKKNEGTDESQNKVVMKLEGKILNQLIHQIDSKLIPQTSFKIKHENNLIQTIVQTACIIIGIVLIIYLFNFEKWSNFVNVNQSMQSLLFWSIAPGTTILAIVTVVGICTYFIYSIITAQNNKNLIKKINLHGNEVEIFSQSDDSFFDKYLNEVLYLFKNSEADAIVFEDLDRYASTIIFQRLREINTLVNNTSDKKIKFFYLLRDDLFNAKDRTKFFDLIIPVVPIVDSSNSFDLFLDLFKKGNIINLFNESLLRNISLYIDDMRILKNIYNEFVIYNTQINTTQQNANKLLSLIVYKNLFPHDFSSLQTNKGTVYGIIESKKNIIAKEKNRLNADICEIENEIEKINKEIAKSEDEINNLYIYPPYGDRNKCTLPEYISEKEERIELVRKKQDGTIDKLKSQIILKTEELKIIEGKKIKELISDKNRQEIFYSETSYDSLKNNDSYDLLVYLLSEGYIDETYQDYMTYFYENSISRNDKIFLRSIVEKTAKPFDYSLDNPAAIVNMLRLYDFDHKEILNYHLLTYLLDKTEEKNSELNHFFATVKKENRLDFVVNYVAKKNQLDKVINYLNICWPEFLSILLSDEKCPDEIKRDFISLYFNYSSDTTLIEININNSIGDYISPNTNTLYIDGILPNVFVEKLNLLNIKFVDFIFKNDYILMWNAVYKNCLYELTWPSIQDILEKKYLLSIGDDYRKCNLTLILSKPDEPLANYVKSSINVYFDLMMKNCVEEITDESNVVKFVLNDASLTDEPKYRYIDHLSTKILSLEDINNLNFCTELINHDNVEFSDKNIVYYFFKNNKEYDKTLVNFVNNSFDKFTLTRHDIDDKYGEHTGDDLFDQTIICNSLNNIAYKEILNKLDFYYESFNLPDIDFDKINILIDIGVIRMNKGSLINMRRLYPENMLYYIKSDFNSYIKLVDEGLFDEEELLSILKTDLNPKDKLELLKYTDSSISIEEIAACDEVIIHILQNNFDVSDLPYIISKYNDFSDAVQVIVEKIVCLYADYIFDNNYTLPCNLMFKLSNRKNIDSTLKLKLLACSTSNMNTEMCKKCLLDINNTIANNYYALFFGNRPKFEINEVNERMLKTFKQKGWITQYRVDGNSYRAIGKRTSSRKTIPIDDFID